VPLVLFSVLGGGGGGAQVPFVLVVAWRRSRSP
jgi:hypothetical protein